METSFRASITLILDAPPRAMKAAKVSTWFGYRESGRRSDSDSQLFRKGAVLLGPRVRGFTASLSRSLLEASAKVVILDLHCSLSRSLGTREANNASQVLGLHHYRGVCSAHPYSPGSRGGEAVTEALVVTIGVVELTRAQLSALAKVFR